MIPYGRQLITDEDVSAVVEALKSPFLTSGPLVERFEEQLCAASGATYAIACANGTAALHLTCLALGIKQDDLGITSPITFAASANCVELCGGRVDFVDIDSTLCLNPEELERYCRTREVPQVVIPVDFAGVVSNLPALHDLAKKYGFFLIEDAAHAIGSTYTYKGKEYKAGSCAHSDAAIFSFHPVKTITTGEGGAVLTNNPEIARKVRLLRSHGITRDPLEMEQCDGGWYYEMHALSTNYRLTDLQCALGISQISRLEKIKKERAAVVKKYNDGFSNTSSLILPPCPLDSSPAFHLYPLQFTAGKETRQQLYTGLKEEGIYCQVHYIPVYYHPYYRKKYGYSLGHCPTAELYYSRCLSLPLYCGLSDSEQEFVIQRILQLLPHHS